MQLNDITSVAESQQRRSASESVAEVSPDNKYSANPMSLPTSDLRSNDRVVEPDTTPPTASSATTDNEDKSAAVTGSAVGKELSPMYTCQPCSTTFVAKDLLIQHQKLYCPALHSSRRSRNPRNHFKKLLNNYGELLSLFCLDICSAFG